MRLLLLLFVAASLVAPLGAEPFTIVNAAKTGEIEVEVERVTGSELHYLKNGSREKIALELLDAENQKALVQFAKEHGLYDRYPPLDIQVAVHDKDKRQEGSSYMRHLWLTPKLIITGAEALAPIPEIEATISVICADTKALYAERRKSYQIRAKETITLPAAKDSARREIDFKAFELEFDEDRDSSNVGGWIYRYWICCLRDPESKRIVHFSTSYNLLEKHLDENPEDRERYIGIAIGGKVPSTQRGLANH